MVNREKCVADKGAFYTFHDSLFPFLFLCKLHVAKQGSKVSDQSGGIAKVPAN